MPDEPPIAANLRAIIKAAGSQKAVARMAKVSDGTLINWIRGLGLRDSKIREAAINLGVSLAWLKDNDGDEEREVAAFRARHARMTAGPRDYLRAVLKARNITPVQLAKRMGYDPGVIENVVNGTGRASEGMIEDIVRELPDVSKEDLMRGSESARVLSADGMHGTHGAKHSIVLPPGMKGRMIPLLSQAQAGGWDAGHDDGGWAGEAIFALNVDDRRAFAIRVSGNSMEPEIREGDVVVCSPHAELQAGCVAVVRTHSDQAFIKFWRVRGEKVTLESANPAYGPIHFPLTEIAGAWPVIQRIASGMITKGTK